MNVQATDVVDVVFRRWKDDGSVVALFPDLVETYGGLPIYCTSYQIVGQHGQADYAYVVSQTKPASLDSDDVRDLKAELERIGYKLRVKRRRSRR